MPFLPLAVAEMIQIRRQIKGLMVAPVVTTISVPAVVVVQARQAVLMEPLKVAMARHHQFLVRRLHTQAAVVAALLILLNQVAQVAVGLAQMTQAT